MTITRHWMKSMYQPQSAAESGEFHAQNTESYGKEGFSKKADATGYKVIIDTNGKLLWPDASGMAKPYLIVTRCGYSGYVGNGRTD